MPAARKCYQSVELAYPRLMRAIQADSGANVFWQKVFRTTLVRLIPFNRAILVTMPSVRERVWPIEQVLELEWKVSSKGAGIKGGGELSYS